MDLWTGSKNRKGSMRAESAKPRDATCAEKCHNHRKDKAMSVEMIDMMRGYEFWREGCGRMSGMVCELLRMAGQPVTLATVQRVVESLPRRAADLACAEWCKRSYCCECLELAHSKAVNEIGDKQFDFLCDYFLAYFPNRTMLAQETMIDSFVGILRALELDPPSSGS